MYWTQQSQWPPIWFITLRPVPNSVLTTRNRTMDSIDRTSHLMMIPSPFPTKDPLGEPPKTLPSLKNDLHYGCEFDCSGFDQFSSTTSFSTVSSSSLSIKTSCISRSHREKDLSSLRSAGSYSSFLRYQTSRQSNTNNESGAWGYFVDTPERWWSCCCAVLGFEAACIMNNQMRYLSLILSGMKCSLLQSIMDILGSK